MTEPDPSAEQVSESPGSPDGNHPRESSAPQAAGVDSERAADAFQSAAEEPNPGFWREFAVFLRQSPSWWLAPLILTLLLLGLAVTLVPVEAVPFIYSLW